MFLIDDLLMMPARGIMAVFREIQNAAQQDSANESEAIRTELSELYMQLETKQLTEAEFDAREKQLLDRLDEIEKDAAEAAIGIGGETGADEDDEDAAEDEYFAGEEDLELDADERDDEDPDADGLQDAEDVEEEDGDEEEADEDAEEDEPPEGQEDES